MRRKYVRGILDMTRTNLLLGGGSLALGALGSTTGQQALGNVGKFMPTMGSLYGMGMMVDVLKTRPIKTKRGRAYRWLF